MSILKSSDILVVPSRIDNIPNVIKEAFFLKYQLLQQKLREFQKLLQMT